MTARSHPSTPDVHMLTGVELFVFVLQAGLGVAPSRSTMVSAAAAPAPIATSVRITSPLGRTGTPGSIRIVAQIQSAQGAELGPVRFYIDDKLLQTDSDGAPYVAEWVDENPFERREISVAVADALGHEVRDRVVLEPYDLVEESQVTSVLVEAGVQDKNGRYLKNVPASSFTVLEDGVPQVLDLAQQE